MIAAPAAEEAARKASARGIQEGQYRFPYHWLPRLEADGSFSTGAFLDWGMEYLTYMSEAARLLRATGARRVLDVGCGDGRFLQFLGAGTEYLGVDYSAQAIELAKALNQSEAFRAEPLASISGPFDAVALIEVMEHIPEDEMGAFMRQIGALLPPDGRAVVSVPTTVRPVQRKHFRHYDLETLREHLALGGLAIIEHHYVFRIGPFARLCKSLCSNRFFTLNPSPLTRAIWSCHRKLSFRAGRRNGAHLLAIAGK